MENPLAPDEPTALCPGNLYARSLTAAHCELVSPNTPRFVAKIDELERINQSLAILTPRFAMKLSTWNLHSHAEGAYPQS